MKTLLYATVFITCVITMVCVADIVTANATIVSLTMQQLAELIKQSIQNNYLQVIATPEVTSEINQVIHSSSAKDDMRATLIRLKENEAIITSALKNKGIPIDLIVIPIVESQYQQLFVKNNSQDPEGIWQMSPDSARKYGLIVTKKRDDRLNIQLETTAALQYLSEMYTEFKDWRLVIVAYELGDDETLHLIKVTGSHDAWVLARSSEAPTHLKKYLSLINAAVIIMHNPSMVINADN